MQKYTKHNDAITFLEAKEEEAMSSNTSNSHQEGQALSHKKRHRWSWVTCEGQHRYCYNCERRCHGWVQDCEKSSSTYGISPAPAPRRLHSNTPGGEGAAHQARNKTPPPNRTDGRHFPKKNSNPSRRNSHTVCDPPPGSAQASWGSLPSYKQAWCRGVRR